MKNVGIHVLDFNDNIIDFISQSDGALINVEMSMNVEEKTETFDFTIENTRAEKLRERNRIIAQDNNGTFREFVIIHIADNFDGTTEIECNASYLEDLKTAKPIKPGKFEAHTTTQALLKTLADTGWEVSDDTEYAGNRTTSWTSHTNPFDLIYMLCTTYDMVPSFYIELGAHTVEHRYVSITKPKNLFKGKEITKGKDLTGMTRTIDLSEVKTALLAVGPEKEDGSRIETVVVDDEAQEIFGLPNRYIWDVYEPETEDENMTLKRLTTLAKTELNKRNQAAISYEVSSIDIHKYYEDINVHLRDIVRVKDRDFRPPLYIEAEVIGIKYNWLADESEFTFGNVIEYEETKLREFFNKRLDEITKKMNDNFSNVHTIVSDVVAGEMEYYERKIFKGTEPPGNPQNDTLWYDTSNPNVAVLRRYWDGEWITQTADDVEKIGGLRREQVMYRDLNNSFINLTIQHSKLQNDVYDVLNNEYLVDDDLKSNLNQALSDVDSVYQNIKTNLDSMDEDTATIGKLVDTQTLFTVYREKLQTLYKYVTEAKISIDRRLKLLQSQYTDEKFNDAMDKIAETLPNGRWDSENQQLYADIPNRNEVENLKTTLQDYTDGQISNLNSVLGKEIDSKINTTKSEISASISSVEQKIDGIEVGGRNLLPSYSEKYEGAINPVITNTKEFDAKLWARSIYSDTFINSILEVGQEYTLSYDIEILEVSDLKEYALNVGLILYDRNTKKSIARAYKKLPREVGYKERQTITFTYEEGAYNILGYTNILSTDGTAKGPQFDNDLIKFSNLKLEKGNIATDWTPAPEDLQNEIVVKSQEISKAQADAAETRAQAYADSKITNEEQARIRQADANVELLQQQQKSLKDEMAAYTDNLINEEERARMDADVAKEEALKAEINLAQTQAKAYADNKITAEEERAIQDAQSKFEEAKKHAEEKAAQAQNLANEYAKVAQENAQAYADNKFNDLNVGGRNLLKSHNDNLNDYVHPDVTSTKAFTSDRLWATSLYSPDYFRKFITPNETYTIHYEITVKSYNGLQELKGGTLGLLLYDYTERKTLQSFAVSSFASVLDNSLIDKKQSMTKTFKMPETFDNKINILSYAGYGENENGERVYPTVEITNLKLEKGTVATDWTPAPEDLETLVKKAQIEAEKAAKAYADAQDNLKETNIKAYADGIVSDEEQRAIADAIAKRDEAKEYAEQKAQEAQEAANQNTSNQLEPITTRVTKNETNITELDNQISAMAKSEDVAQKLRDVDGRLTPLETTVKSNKATLDILPTQIESKVSKQDYTTDQNNIVQRLDNADSARVQLANQITDKVTTTQLSTSMQSAKDYIDKNQTSNELRMNKMETSISQNGREINAKVSQQDFNASRKTLSQVISEISATTKGINLSYDENGNIQSYTMDRNGIQLRGDKVDITVNKDFNVMASKVDDKVGKNEIINRLNLSPEGLDINVNNIGIRGGDSVDYIDIRNNSILSYGSFTRTWANETDTANLRLGIQGGTVKVQNRTTGYNLYLTEKGLSTMLAGAGDETAGTLEFHSKKYNDTSRGVRLHSTYGAVALESDYSRIILNANLTVNIESNYGIYFRPYRDNRTGNNEFAMYVKQNDIGAYTDGVLKYGNVSSDTSQYGSGIRFSKSSVNSVIYATNKDGDIGTGDFYGNKIYGALTAKETNAYVLTDGALRVTDTNGYNGDNTNYRDIQCQHIASNTIRTRVGKDFYIGVSSNELRVTNNLFWNGGDTGYKPVRASAFNNASLEQYKTDIKKWDYDALTVIANDLDLYQFKYKNEEGKEKGLNHRGVIIGRDYKTPDEFIYGDGVNLYEMVTWSLRAIQQLNEKINTLEEQLNEQSITS
ncbi:phage tail spike protein [Staphylococcus hominis]